MCVVVRTVMFAGVTGNVADVPSAGTVTLGGTLAAGLSIDSETSAATAGGSPLVIVAVDGPPTTAGSGKKVMLTIGGRSTCVGTRSNPLLVTSGHCTLSMRSPKVLATSAAACARSTASLGQNAVRSQPLEMPRALTSLIHAAAQCGVPVVHATSPKSGEQAGGTYAAPIFVRRRNTAASA